MQGLSDWQIKNSLIWLSLVEANTGLCNGWPKQKCNALKRTLNAELPVVAEAALHFIIDFAFNQISWLK